jgi:hypothetical protein
LTPKLRHNCSLGSLQGIARNPSPGIPNGTNLYG